jgi:uncharacterized membrane protein YdcZ (DUF606 family)
MYPAVTVWVNDMGGSFGLVVKLACGQTKKSPHALTHAGWWSMRNGSYGLGILK